LPAGFVEEVEEKVALPTINEMARLGAPFVGLLYCGLIITQRGIRVIEFNARFGDPETQVVLRRLNSSLSNLLFKAATGHLEGVSDPVFDKDVAITVVLASEGYPDSNAPSRPIYGISDAEKEGVEVCHAATAFKENKDGEEALVSTGGRVLSVVATGKDFAAARAQAYAGIEKIQLQGSHYRKDIAKKVVE
jgi:phosphoribosylamine--glycine ligase